MSILWFGLGNPPAVFLISLGAFFPVLMNTIAGVRNVDNIYLRAARNLGAGQATIFRRVIPPALYAAAVVVVFFGILLAARVTGHWHSGVSGAEYLRIVPSLRGLAHP